MLNKIFLVPKTILIEAKKLKEKKLYSEALELLMANGVEFDMIRGSIGISKCSNFEKHPQPNKVRNVKSRWRERIFMGVHFADL